MNLKNLSWMVIIFLLSCTGNKTKHDGLQLVYDSVLSDPELWVPEIQDKNGSTITFSENKMEIDVSKGATIWFKELLKGDVVIEFDATVISAGKPNDRVSDLNCFWMFSDPVEENGSLKFNENNRNGKFSNYHTLQGYYVGLGGHNNTKTRFRRYNGEINRTLLPEHDLSLQKYLIIPNKKYHIQLVLKGKKIQYIRDGVTIFDWDDEQALTKGWFAFRTVTNHMVIENFRIYQFK